MVSLWRVPVDSIEQIKIRHTIATTPVLVGALCGMSLGIAVGLAYAEDDEPGDDCFVYCREAIDREATIVLYGLAGGALGTVVGLAVGRSEWSEIPVDNLKISLMPTSRNDFGLSLAIRF